MHSKTSKHAKPFSRHSIALFVGAIIALAGGWLFAYVWHWQNRPHVLEIYCFSTSSTVAVFIRTPEGHTALIDGGKDDTIVRDLTSVMPFYDRTIDELVLTDDDDIHATGLVSVLKRYSIKKVFEMGSVSSSLPVSTSTSAYATFEDIVAEKHISDEKVGKGDIMNIGELSAGVLFPPVSVGIAPADADMPASTSADFKFSKTNAPTLAFEMTYASTTFFFGGLITKTEQKYVTKYIATDIATTATTTFSPDHPTLMLLPHGENVSAVDGGFFTAVHPAYIVVSKKPLSTSTKPKKAPKKPPFSIETVPGLHITNIALEGDAEFVSDGANFTEKKL